MGTRAGGREGGEMGIKGGRRQSGVPGSLSEAGRLGRNGSRKWL